MFLRLFRKCFPRLTAQQRLELYLAAGQIARQRLAAVEEPPAPRRSLPAPQPPRGLAALIPGAVAFRPYTLTPPQL